MFLWTDDSIKLWKRAEKYTDHYKILGNELINYINKDEEVYDIGCGLGFVDIEMAPYVKSIKGFDIENKVLTELEKTSKRKAIKNIRVSNSDWTKEGDGSCDTPLETLWNVLMIF